MHPLQTHQRQVHLDFHTSPFIPGVGADFDAKEFSATLKRAHVNSVTVFAKCHHGYAYYPSKACAVHPTLAPGRDLLGEQIEALHREGIRCPIYITVGWDALAAQTHPEWRAMKKDGHFADWQNHPGMWRFLNWLHPGLQQHVEEVTRETLDRYGREVDGYFYDICFFPKFACWSPESRKFREKHHVLDDTLEGFERFQAKAQESFSRRYRDLIRAVRPEATVFFNAGSDTFLEPGLGGRARYGNMSHMEIESLPSGFWGYFHFPRLARSVGHWGKPWLGMTGRFQTMWGDFGGLKPQAALEFECFRPQALGGANSIGDQLPPRGRLDPVAYDLIGAVYEQVAASSALWRPALHRAAPAHYINVEKVLHRVRRLGYQRPGLVVDDMTERLAYYAWSAAFLEYTRRHPEMGGGSILSGRVITGTRLHRWFRKEEPDVILAPRGDVVRGMLLNIGLRLPRDVGLVHIGGYKPDSSVALVDQEPAKIGSAAVDLLVAMFYTGERGLPANPLQILVEGTWLDGPTLPKCPQRATPRRR